MEAFLGYITKQAMNHAMRSGFILTTSFVLSQSQKLLVNAPKSGVRDELVKLQQRLQHKIRIISPAIDMIELIAARGNTSLESAISLTKELREEIISIGQRLAHANMISEKAARSAKISDQVQKSNEHQLQLIISDMKKLLERIEDAVPLISLAITTSGVTLSTSLPRTVSPSRLLQASTLLTAGDIQYDIAPELAVQIGPTFTLTVYMLFAGHNRPQNEEEIRETTWKEVMHKASVKLRRVPLDLVAGTGSGSHATSQSQIKSAFLGPVETDIPAESRSEEYAYQLMIVEDFEDDRMHDFEDQVQPGQFDDVKLAGVREMIPIHEVSKIFYADTSKVLNIGTDAETNHPVLLLKRDVNAIPPRRMTERSREESHVKPDHKQVADDPWRLPPSLDPEWIAFEVYAEESAAADDDDDPLSDTDAGDSKLKPSPSLELSISKLNISSPSPNLTPLNKPQSTSFLATSAPPRGVNAIPTSLSLLELLLRLTSLQQFQQQRHLSIADELLNFFLEESASTGAGGDEKQRQAVRMDARRKVGWDPYDESPIKRRGEDYQYQSGYYEESMSPGEGLSRQMSPVVYDNGNPKPYVPNDYVPATYTPGAYRNASPGPYVPAAYTSGSRVWKSPAHVSPQSPQMQTRSITKLNDIQAASPQSPSPSPSVSAATGRSDWLRRQGVSERKGSPLRPSTGMTDEGLGTSPATLSGSGMGAAKDNATGDGGIDAGLEDVDSDAIEAELAEDARNEADEQKNRAAEKEAWRRREEEAFLKKEAERKKREEGSVRSDRVKHDSLWPNDHGRRDTGRPNRP